LRIARATTGRDKIVRFSGHYHGWFNNVLVSMDENGNAAAMCGGQPAKEYEDTLVLPWNDLDALTKLLQSQGDEIACVITEPILVNSGSCMPQDDFLPGLIELCRAHGALSIFDEVITGFRVALGGAREYFDLQPDLSVYAKAMAGGFTMSAVGGHRGVFDALRDGRTVHFGTYNGSSHNLAAAIATIDILSRPGTYERMHGHGNAIRERLEAKAHEHGHQLVTSGVGTAFSMHFDLEELPLRHADTLAANKEKFAAFRRNMLENNVLILPDGRWYISAVHTDKELERTLAAIDAGMAAI
jgi:glutamate-1-semialdehyde 2,1-aminomutase